MIMDFVYLRSVLVNDCFKNAFHTDHISSPLLPRAPFSSLVFFFPYFLLHIKL